MTALSVILAAVGVAGAVFRPWRLPIWVLPVAAAIAGLAAGAVSGHQAGHALRTLADPIGFLLAAVPLAVLLDRLGFFHAAARRLTERGHAAGALWTLAAVVTTVLNLDAGIVLLTPLYVRIARQRGTAPLLLAAQPLILSWLASSALPVSNLTNLIVAARTDATTWDFVSHLGLPSLVAVIVGWYCYARLPTASWPSCESRAHPTGPSTDLAKDAGAAEAPGAGIQEAPDAGATEEAGDLADAEGERRALRIGGAVAVFVLAGFVLGPSIGIQAWVVALIADAVLVAVQRQIPWRSVPVSTGLVAASLGILAAGVAAHIHIVDLLGGTDAAGLARSAGVSALLANLVNNLPALLVLVPGSHPGATTWAVLVGVNMGPVLLATGTLASLLWLATLRRLDVEVSSWDVTRFGVRVGLPAAAAGLAVLLVLHAS